MFFIVRNNEFTRQFFSDKGKIDMICKQCRLDKELEINNFRLNTNNKTGFSYTCKDCEEQNFKRLQLRHDYSYTIELIEKTKQGIINSSSLKMATKTLKVRYPSWKIKSIKPLTPKNYCLG
jgi:hypothetical protein